MSDPQSCATGGAATIDSDRGAWETILRVVSIAKQRDAERAAIERRWCERMRLTLRLCKSGRFAGLATWLDYGYQSAIEFTVIKRGRIIRRGFRFPTSAVTSPMSRVARGWPMCLARHAKPTTAIAREMREASD